MARGRRRSRRNEQLPGWIWMLGGFSLGLIVALGIYLAERVPSPGAARTTPTAAAPTPQAADNSQQTAATAQPDPTAAAAGPPAPGAAGETEFSFYEVLPEFEVVVPDTGEVLRADPRAVAAARAGNFIVQAGSFRALADADRMQARLALLGFESHIQRVAIDAYVYHRVRIGPVTDLGELNRIRRRLRDEQIEYLLIDTPE